MVVPVGAWIVDGQVHGHRAVSHLVEVLDQRGPTPGAVEGAVNQDEGGHGDRSGRVMWDQSSPEHRTRSRRMAGGRDLLVAAQELVRLANRGFVGPADVGELAGEESHGDLSFEPG